VNYEELLAFAGRNPMLSLALVGLTVAIIATEVATSKRATSRVAAMCSRPS